MMGDELKPCPFCGSKGRIQKDGDSGSMFIHCLGGNCLVAVGENYDRDAMPDHAFYDEDAAIAAWNTRTLAAELAQKDAEIVAANERIAQMREALIGLTYAIHRVQDWGDDTRVGAALRVAESFIDAALAQPTPPQPTGGSTK